MPYVQYKYSGLTAYEWSMKLKGICRPRHLNAFYLQLELAGCNAIGFGVFGFQPLIVGFGCMTGYVGY